jgi:hypothetical protein
MLKQTKKPVIIPWILNSYLFLFCNFSHCDNMQPLPLTWKM